MNENLADEIRKTIESIKDMKTQASGINNYLSILEGLLRTDYQKKVEEAYQKGLADGSLTVFETGVGRKDYQRGLDDAWEAARKIAQQWEEDTDTEHRLVIDDSIRVTLDSMTASEAIAKLKAYEEKQKADDEIKVGDEVRLCRHKVPYIVTSCDGDDDTYILMTVNGGFIKAGKYNVRKTGRRFGIGKILEEMRT